jgi:L-amino acid N-acyltransferase YncA
MWLQYRFFRLVAAVEADRLYASEGIFQRLGWELVDTRRHAGGLVQAHLWYGTKGEDTGKGDPQHG